MTMREVITKNHADFIRWLAGEPLINLAGLYGDLYDHYLESGEMPYGVAKARTGDPYTWIEDRLEAVANSDDSEAKS